MRRGNQVDFIGGLAVGAVAGACLGLLVGALRATARRQEDGRVLTALYAAYAVEVAKGRQEVGT